MEENGKTYGAFRLPPRPSEGRDMEQTSRADSGMQRSSEDKISLRDDVYYEIEYDSSPMPGVGKFVQKPHKLQPPEKDEIRERFASMRDIARNNRVMVFGNSRFYNRNMQRDNSRIFYKQGMFMKDFEDDYEESVPYTEYYPYYQMMGYRQLRTYFTWRTKVRKGRVEETSLSYAYLYIYELLNNIGVEDSQDGLDRLLAFWREFRVYQPSVDKYMPRWLKDYYIYYDLPQTFSEFVMEHDLSGYYPELADSGDRFELFCSISKYDIRKSNFYGEDREALIRDCFDFTLDRLTKSFAERGMDFESLVFLPAKSMAVWTPFQEALFYPWRIQRDRQVAISTKEVYACAGNQWTYQTALTTESGRRLLGYILKQMEAVLRRALNYKYKITAGMGALSSATIKLLEDAGVSLEQCITDAVKEFYWEATKTVVNVDRGRLDKIRREALQTQEKLLVPEDERTAFEPTQRVQAMSEPKVNADLRQGSDAYSNADMEDSTQRRNEYLQKDDGLTFEPAQIVHGMPAEPTNTGFGLSKEAEAAVESFMSEPDNVCLHGEEESQETTPWNQLKLALSEVQLQALELIIHGSADIKKFADDHGVMLEVLADGINEKAVDMVGDSLLDDEFTIYDDYLEQVEEMLEG